MNEECQEFAAREIDKWQKWTCPRLMLHYFVVWIFFFFFSYKGKSNHQQRITDNKSLLFRILNGLLWRSEYFLYFSRFYSRLRTENQDAFCVGGSQGLPYTNTNNRAAVWDPAKSNWFTVCTWFLPVKLCRGRLFFFYSSQGWTKEVTWQHLHFLLYIFFFFLPLQKE